MGLKTCIICGEIKLKNEENFHRDYRGFFINICIKCCNKEKFLFERGIKLSGVYFVAGDMKVVRIGRTGNLRHRMHSISGLNDRSIKLIGFIEEESLLEMIHIEKILHQKFKHLLKKGSWFYLTDEIIDYIKENDML